MSYFKVLGLEKEPFSTSPDPAFFFNSRDHKAAFCRLQISISLKRGMCVILGDVGTGKTTLSRKLSQALSEDENVYFRMILNPFFRTEKQFLSRLAGLFHVQVPAGATALDYMEAVEKALFEQGIENGKTPVLLIDEAQILPDFVFEILRILLNYETNEYKILQLVLVGQMELLPRISRLANFWDRIAFKYILKPLGEAELADLIDFRLRQAGYKEAAPMFTTEAVRLIRAHTGGYPRKVSFLCHNALESLVMFDKRIVDEALIRDVIANDVPPTEEPEPAGKPSGAVEPVPDPSTAKHSTGRFRLKLVGAG